MTGRKPQPYGLIDNKERRLTKLELEERKECEPTGCSAVLRCPHNLSKEAKKEWRRIIKLYNELDIDILNDLDKTALIMYCEAVSVYKAAQDEWVRLKQIFEITQNKKIKLNSAITAMNEQTKVITSLSEQLCLTPVGRARMGVARSKQKEESNPMAQFAGG